jgi:Tol biopolymer transport system component
MTRIFTVTAVFGALLVFVLPAADTAREQTLQRAIDLMESKGDLAKAMPLFEDAARSSDRAVAARALLYIGEAQERQGTEKARATYERIVKEFTTQTETVAAAQKRLAALGAPLTSGTLAKRLLCAGCGDYSSDFSRDGRWVVFTDRATGDLTIRDMSTGEVKRLLAKPGIRDDYSEPFAGSPIFSPDLRQIVYAWGRNNPVVHIGQLRVMANEPGAKSRVLAENPEVAWYGSAAWFADGKSVLVGLIRPDQTKQFARVSMADGTAKVLKSLEWRNPGRPWISPDGQYIVYSAYPVNPSNWPPASTDPRDRHIYLLATDGSSETEIVKTAGINESPVWTPDGKHILFTSDRSGKFDLWSVAVQKGRAVGTASLVSSEIGRIDAAGMRGNSYYYYANGPQVEYVNIAEFSPSNASQSRMVDPLESFVGIAPTWSPDGNSLAFKRHHPGSPDRYDLVIHSLETGEERAPLSGIGTTGNGAARWSRDGASVVTGVWRNDGHRGFYRIDLKNGNLKEFPTGNGGLDALSPDEKTLILRRPPEGQQPYRVVAFDLTTSQESVLATFQVQPSITALSPDGRMLAIGWVDGPRERRTLHIARVSIDGSGFREVFSQTSRLSGARTLAWDRDGRSILFDQQQPGGAGQWGVMRLPVNGGPATLVFATRPLNGYSSFDLSPDGSIIAYGSDDPANELWALDNVLPMLK